MSHPITKLVFIMVLVAFASPLLAQGIRTSDRVKMLQSESPDEREQASKDIYGAGLDDKVLYDMIAASLADGLPGVTKSSPRLHELAWHALALGGSGDMTYMPLLEQAKNSGVRWLAGHAKDAIADLRTHAEAGRPYMSYEKVLVITESQSQRCRLIKQVTCTARRSSASCISEQNESVAEAGGNAIMHLMTSDQTGIWPFAGGTVVSNFYHCPPQP
ncbi:MAG TPA: hypothetical protein VFS82_05390 [Lysobacter sp.]|nr:hypothetical protein [Lysobacter sp.]